MGGFIPTCHTQTFVEVAKLEILMHESATLIGLFLVIYLSRSSRTDWPSEHKFKGEGTTKSDYYISYGCLATKEIKSLYNRGASYSVYRDGTVRAFAFYFGKGGRPISQTEFNSLDFHATHGGVWKKEINNIDCTLKEVIDLMPTLNLPPPPPQPPTPAKIPKRDYGFRVY